MAWRRRKRERGIRVNLVDPPPRRLRRRPKKRVFVFGVSRELSGVGEGSDDDGWLEISEQSNWNIIFSAALSSGGVLDPYFTVAMRRIYHPIKIDSRAQIAPCLPRSSSPHEWPSRVWAERSVDSAQDVDSVDFKILKNFLFFKWNKNSDSDFKIRSWADREGERKERGRGNKSNLFLFLIS